MTPKAFWAEFCAASIYCKYCMVDYGSLKKRKKVITPKVFLAEFCVASIHCKYCMADTIFLFMAQIMSKADTVEDSQRKCW